MAKVSTDVQAVIKRLFWIVTACMVRFEGLLRLRNAIRGTACGMPFKRQQSFDHCPHVCWHLRHRPCASWSRSRLCEIDKVCDLTHFVSRTKKCINFQSIVSLWSHFEIHTNNKHFSSMSQSQTITWIKQKPDDNCQTTRIVSKSFVQFFSIHLE